MDHDSVFNLFFDLMFALIVTYMIFENNQKIFWSDSQYPTDQ